MSSTVSKMVRVSDRREVVVVVGCGSPIDFLLADANDGNEILQAGVLEVIPSPSTTRRLLRLLVVSPARRE